MDGGSLRGWVRGPIRLLGTWKVRSGGAGNDGMELTRDRPETLIWDRGIGGEPTGGMLIVDKAGNDTRLSGPKDLSSERLRQCRRDLSVVDERACLKNSSSDVFSME